MVANALILIWFALPIPIWVAHLCIRRWLPPMLLYILTGLLILFTAAAGYATLFASVWTIDAQLEAEMNRFDLDGDGGIGGDELTPEAQRAAEAWASDTGRTMAMVFGLPITVVWYAIMFALLFGGEWAFRKLVLKNPTTESKSERHEDQQQDGNPYRAPHVP